MTTPAPPDSSSPKPVTLRTLRQRVAEGTPIPVLTAYDATTAHWLAEGGIDVLLVGDSAGQVILGQPSTIHAPLPFLVEITAAVKRGAPHAFVIGDLPFGSYQESTAQAIRNATKFLTRGRADAVKLEIGPGQVEALHALAEAGIPVIAHVGFKPQHTQMTGTPTVAGKTPADRDKLVTLAQQCQAAGAVMLLLEATTAEAAQAVLDATQIPVIGCGAGPNCHGHVVVLHDLLGLSPKQPAFAPPFTDGGPRLAKLAAQWHHHITAREYLADGGPYHMA
ncbi:MAG: 3-methyl-2-oxobutanoate hydroxymethyltransferase [Planctomycetota bacterium]